MNGCQKCIRGYSSHMNYYSIAAKVRFYNRILFYTLRFELPQKKERIFFFIKLKPYSMHENLKQTKYQTQSFATIFHTPYQGLVCRDDIVSDIGIYGIKFQTLQSNKNRKFQLIIFK